MRRAPAWQRGIKDQCRAADTGPTARACQAWPFRCLDLKDSHVRFASCRHSQSARQQPPRHRAPAPGPAHFALYTVADSLTQNEARQPKLGWATSCSAAPAGPADYNTLDITPGRRRQLRFLSQGKGHVGGHMQLAGKVASLGGAASSRWQRGPGYAFSRCWLACMAGTGDCCSWGLRVVFAAVPTLASTSTQELL